MKDPGETISLPINNVIAVDDFTASAAFPNRIVLVSVWWYHFRMG